MIKCLECGKELSVIKHTHLRYRCTGRFKTILEYKEAFPGAPVIDDEVRKKISNSENTFIERHGFELGTLKWEEYRKKLSAKNKFEAFQQKGFTKEEFDVYNKSRAVSKENLVRKHGEEIGILKFEEYRRKQAKNGNTLEYFIEKYGEFDGTIRYEEVCKKKGITLENMIMVHGEDLGMIKYHNFLEKTKGNYISLSGSQFVRDLVEVMPADYFFHDGIYSKEFCVWADRPFMFDFVITSPKKLAIEFNGDFWHANPLKYQADDIIPTRGKHQLAKDIWNKDKAKMAALESRGFKIKIVWESDYLNNRSNIIKDCIEWIANA